MSLLWLSVEQFRNLQSVEIEPAAGLNVIFGDNAAGKTSLLEAIYFLGRVRSFRPTRPDQLIRQGSEELTVRGRIGRAGDEFARVAVQRARDRTRVRINGEDVASLSALARYLPVQVINTESQRLLSDGPAVRRSFISWGVFHVEHDYHGYWRRYDRALRQRNAALRTQDTRLAKSWEPELVSTGEALDVMRRRFVEALARKAQALFERWLPDGQLTLNYRSGWSSERDLATAIDEGREREMELGYSLYGPHRSDVAIRSHGMDAQHRLSRGQQKLTAIALLLAQAELMQGDAVLLIDDLPAELDLQRRQEVLNLIASIEAQAFITCTHRESLSSAPPARWFHVEHGAYRVVV